MPQVPAPQQPAPDGISERQWIVFLNLSGLAGLFLPSVGNILGPLIIWLIKKPESAAIDAAGRNVLNFQISWTIWIILSAIVGGAGSCLIVPLIIPLAAYIAWLVFAIIGAFKASNGEAYAFPLTLKML
ncbi:MAG: DUF4870 domain-containing protein [Verrucomicrobiae bacterium]